MNSLYQINTIDLTNYIDKNLYPAIIALSHSSGSIDTVARNLSQIINSNNYSKDIRVVGTNINDVKKISENLPILKEIYNNIEYWKLAIPDIKAIISLFEQEKKISSDYAKACLEAVADAEEDLKFEQKAIKDFTAEIQQETIDIINNAQAKVENALKELDAKIEEYTNIQKNVLPIEKRLRHLEAAEAVRLSNFLVHSLDKCDCANTVSIASIDNALKQAKAYIESSERLGNDESRLKTILIDYDDPDALQDKYDGYDYRTFFDGRPY